MNSSELISIARTDKDKIRKYFYGSSKQQSRWIAEFNKHELNTMLLLSIQTPVELCTFFGMGITGLQETINYPEYTQYKILKRKGGTREIFAPEKYLKHLQKKLNYFLQAYYLCIKPNHVHGFVINPHYLGKHCNIVENAKNHVGKKFLLNIDLKDFFPSIPARLIKQVFMSDVFQFNDQIATALTLLSTYKGILPIGAPTSPVISNFVCAHLDSDLINFCKTHSLAYTRYADDLSFSSNNSITDDNILDIINLIKQNNFQINEKKLRLKTGNRKQTVTGITVNNKVNVDRKLLKKIRAMLHDLTTNGIESAAQNHFHLKGKVNENLKWKFLYRVNGYINFVGQVRGKDDSLYQKFKSNLQLVTNPTSSKLIQ